MAHAILVSPRAANPATRSADFTEFASSMAIVMGPTPPGTGVIFEAIGATAA
jgi:hypothetical protein